MIAQGTWIVEPSTSVVRFEVSHAWGLGAVNGRFSRFEGRLVVDSQGAKASFTVYASSIDTGSKRRDKHLRAAPFFDVERHDEIAFQSTAVAAREGGLTITGELRLGQSHASLRLPVDVYEQVDGLLLRAHAILDREQFGFHESWVGGIHSDPHVQLDLILVRER